MKSFESDSDKALPNSILEQAGYYLMLLDEPQVKASDSQAFKEWVQQSDLHRQAFKKVATVWGKMDVLHGLADMFPIESVHIVAVEPEEKWYQLFPWGQTLVASFAIFFAVGFYFYSNDPSTFNNLFASKVYAEQVETAVGQIKTIDIADGTTITANTNSKLRVELTKEERVVTLDRGEAYFEVEHDPARHFDVVAGDTIVRAIGTAFSVQKEGDELEVVVTEGVVEILNAHTDVSRRVYPNAERDLLRPGQSVQIDKHDVQIEKLDKGTLAREHSWRQGMLVFDGESLAEVVKEFSRYHPVNIEIVEDDIRNIRVGGYFNSNDLAGMLNSLEENFGIEVSYLDAEKVRLSAKILK
jgi:transmembrane sensor